MRKTKILREILHPLCGFRMTKEVDTNLLKVDWLLWDWGEGDIRYNFPTLSYGE